MVSNTLIYHNACTEQFSAWVAIIKCFKRNAIEKQLVCYFQWGIGGEPVSANNESVQWIQMFKTDLHFPSAKKSWCMWWSNVKHQPFSFLFLVKAALTPSSLLRRRLGRRHHHHHLANTPADAANVSCGPSSKGCTISWTRTGPPSEEHEFITYTIQLWNNLVVSQLPRILTLLNISLDGG